MAAHKTKKIYIHSAGVVCECLFSFSIFASLSPNCMGRMANETFKLAWSNWKIFRHNQMALAWQLGWLNVAVVVAHTVSAQRDKYYRIVLMHFHINTKIRTGLFFFLPLPIIIILLLLIWMWATLLEWKFCLFQILFRVWDQPVMWYDEQLLLLRVQFHTLFFLFRLNQLFCDGMQRHAAPMSGTHVKRC